MTRPIFLSYSWNDLDEVDRLDALLRFRGVPVWRDRRDMQFGTYQEDEVRQAIREECSGFCLYLTGSALTGKSGFITQIELPAMDDRRSVDGQFMCGAVFREQTPSAGHAEVQSLTGIDVGASLGIPIDRGAELDPQLRAAATAILHGYLHSQRGNGPPEILLDTRNAVPWRADGLLHIGWSPPLGHAIENVDTDCWTNDLLPALSDTRKALIASGAGRQINVSGTPHLSAALALGFEFRRPAGWQIAMHDSYGQRWVTEHVAPSLGDWRASSSPGPTGAGDVLVVAVHARHDVSNAVRTHRITAGASRATLHIRPPADGPVESVDPSLASALAAGIAEEIRSTAREYNTRETHLYLAGPWPLAVLLGWQLASSGPITSFESTADRHDYRPACRIT